MKSHEVKNGNATDYLSTTKNIIFGMRVHLVVKLKLFKKVHKNTNRKKGEHDLMIEHALR